MNLTVIESVLLDQQEELESLREENLISRPEEALINTNLIKTQRS